MASDGHALPPPSAPLPEEPASTSNDKGGKPWWKRWWVIAIGAVLAFVIVGAALGGGGDGDDEGDAAPPETSAEAASDGTTETDTTVPEVVVDTTSSPTTAPPTTEESTTIATTTTTLPPTTTAPPAPVVVEGSGDQVMAIGQTLTSPQVVLGTNDGDSNFVVYLLDDDLEEVELAVNEIGPASSKTLQLARDGDSASHIQVQAEGNWRVEFVEMVTAIESGVVVSWDGAAPISGTGTDLIFYDGEPGILQYSNTGDSNFIVYGLSSEGNDLLVNEIGPIDGSSRITRGPLLMQIEAEGDWTFTVQPV